MKRQNTCSDSVKCNHYIESHSKLPIAVVNYEHKTDKEKDY